MPPRPLHFWREIGAAPKLGQKLRNPVGIVLFDGRFFEFFDDFHSQQRTPPHEKKQNRYGCWYKCISKPPFSHRQNFLTRPQDSFFPRAPPESSFFPLDLPSRFFPRAPRESSEKMENAIARPRFETRGNSKLTFEIPGGRGGPGQKI